VKETGFKFLASLPSYGSAPDGRVRNAGQEYLINIKYIFLLSVVAMMSSADDCAQVYSMQLSGIRAARKRKSMRMRRI